MQESTIRQTAFAARTPLSSANPATWFGIGLCLVMVVPIVSVMPWMQTFIHPWRAELAASLFLPAFLIWGSRNTNFRNSLANVNRPEFFAIILPCSLFIVWSLFSAFYAGSLRSVLHHSLVWSIYLIFYFFVRFFLNRPADNAVLGLAMASVVWMIGLPAVFEYYTSGISGGAGSIGVRYAKYAEMLNALFPLVAAYSLKLKGKAFWLGSATVVLIWLFAIGSLSRTAAGLYIIGFAAMAGVVFTLRRFRHYRLKFVLLLALLISVPVVLHSIFYFGQGGVPLVERMGDDATRESNSVRPFFSRIALEMFRAHPFTGVGADNFGLEFNRYRGSYAAGNPGDTNLAIAESEIPERAHNEFLQVAAELGILGLLILGWLVGSIAWMLLRAVKNRRKVSLSTFGALIGLVLFLASSVVTSYSFRLAQNGLAFFILLAIAARGLLPAREKEGPVKVLSPLAARLGFSAGLIACCLFAAFSVSRAAAVWYVYEAEAAKSIDEAAPLFQRASALDDQNASISASHGFSLFLSGRYPGAAAQFRRAIDLGRATSIDYSYLASAQVLAGDKPAAAATMAEAVRIYPFSTFVRTRYAVLLKETADTAGASAEFETAMKIDRRQAETWRNLIEDGAAAASRRSFADNLLPVMDLKPKNAIYAMLAEREVLHPEEKVTIQF